ncbi:GNAT family N-acetyltransferase [Lentzea tibetensis]|uniref:GNAT family N-acetyltransferase n=1 Tax=Lentzea tibetensis TaxID=2591470 RepID=UPI001645B06C|nr:GNAT family N-acetyltransferase [Lentzea tibetensis]
MELRQLTVADVPACMKVAADRNWAHSDRTWRFLLELGTGWGVFDGDELVGTTVVTSYSGISAISMVLVDSRYGRQGIGGELVSHVLDSGVSCLYATPYGKPLYERLGFHSVGKVTTYSGVYPRDGGGISRPAEPADLPFVVALDAEAFGVERAALWEGLMACGSVRVADSGVVASTLTNGTTMIGPVVSRFAADAIALVCDAAARAGQVKVHLHDDWVARHVRARGVSTVGSSCDLMVRNASDVPGDRSLYHAPVSMALG